MKRLIAMAMIAALALVWGCKSDDETTTPVNTDITVRRCS